MNECMNDHNNVIPYLQRVKVKFLNMLLNSNYIYIGLVCNLPVLSKYNNSPYNLPCYLPYFLLKLPSNTILPFFKNLSSISQYIVFCPSNVDEFVINING